MANSLPALAGLNGTTMNDDMRKITDVLDNMRSDPYPLEEYGYIGKRGVRRIDGYEKATGKAVYTIDMKLHGMPKSPAKRPRRWQWQSAY